MHIRKNAKKCWRFINNNNRNYKLNKNLQSIYKKNIEWRINKYNDYFDIDTLYDLIQAGLVEKVKN